jgi:hypothetical protein
LPLQQQARRDHACGRRGGSPSLCDEQPRHQDECVRFHEDGGAHKGPGRDRSIMLNGEQRCHEQCAKGEIDLPE